MSFQSANEIIALWVREKRNHGEGYQIRQDDVHYVWLLSCYSSTIVSTILLFEYIDY